MEQDASQLSIFHSQSIPPSPYFRNLGAALADDASDELVGHRHLVGLLLGSLAPRLAGQQGQS